MDISEEKDSDSAYYYERDSEYRISLYSVSPTHVIRYRCTFDDTAVLWEKSSFGNVAEGLFDNYLQTHTRLAQSFIGEFYENIGLKRMRPPKTVFGEHKE